MPWIEATLTSTVWLLLSAVKTTNPSSFTLASVGVVVYLSYQVLVRPGHARRCTLPMTRPVAKPQAVGEQRRVA